MTTSIKRCRPNAHFQYKFPAARIRQSVSRISTAQFFAGQQSDFDRPCFRGYGKSQHLLSANKLSINQAKTMACKI